MKPQRFLKATAETFRFMPKYGRPDSAPQITLYDPQNNVIQAATPMTLPAAATTDAVAPDAANDRLMSVDDVSGFKVGDRCFAKNNLGQIEYPIIDGVDSASNNLYFLRDLKLNYISGDTIAPHECTYDLTTLLTANSGKYFRANITYDVDGESHYENLHFHVRNKVFRSKLTTQDIYDSFPDFDQNLLARNWDRQIEAAFDRIYMDLEAVGIDLDRFHGGFFEQAHLYRTMVIISERWI